jgi:hypothetical protein
MPNRYEIEMNFDPDWPLDANEDTDLDGQSNGSERIAFTDPRDPNDVLKISRWVQTETDISVTWPTVNGVNYRLWWSSDLGSWNPISDHVGTGELLTAEIEKLNLPKISRSFIRVSVRE